MNEPEKMRTIEVEFSSRGPIRITIPDSWKVTFGALVPAKAGSSQGPYGLRLWEGTDKQRAAFPDVIAFRDVTIPVEYAAVRRYGTEEWYADDGKTWEAPERAALVQKAWKPEAEVIDSEPPWQKEALGPDAPDDLPWESRPSARKW